MPNWDDFSKPKTYTDGSLSKKRDPMRGPKNYLQVKTWNGQPTNNMEDSHVMNAILYCEKRFAEAFNNFLTCHPTSSKQFHFESVSDMYPEYENLIAEWEYRKSR